MQHHPTRLWTLLVVAGLLTATGLTALGAPLLPHRAPHRAAHEVVRRASQVAVNPDTALNGAGAVNFTPGSGVPDDVATGFNGTDSFTGLGNLSVTVDVNGVAHYVTLVGLANEVTSGAAVIHGGIIHYTLAPTAGATPQLCNVLALHASTEGDTPGFEDKPWSAYDPRTDSLYISWTHFVAGTSGASDIMVARLPKASTSVPLASATANSPTFSEFQRLDVSGFTQGSNVEVDTSGNVFVQWEDVNSGNENDTTVNSSRISPGSITVVNSDVQTVDSVNLNYGVVVSGNFAAADDRIRLGPFPGAPGSSSSGTDSFAQGSGVSVSGLRQNSFPLMAIDRLTSTEAGKLYTVWQQANARTANDTYTINAGNNAFANAGNPNAGSTASNPNETEIVQSDSDIVLTRTNPGTLALELGPVTVNQGSPNFTDQFEPAITVSPIDGSLHVLYLDRSQDPPTFSGGSGSNEGTLTAGNTRVGAALEISTNGGTSFSSPILVPAPSDGSALLPSNPATVQSQGFDPVFGDYIGIQSTTDTSQSGQTDVVGALNGLDASFATSQNSAEDPLSLVYSFASGTAGAVRSGTLATFNIHLASASAATDTFSEMFVALPLGGIGSQVGGVTIPAYVSTNDFTDDTGSAGFVSTDDGHTWTESTSGGQSAFAPASPSAGVAQSQNVAIVAPASVGGSGGSGSSGGGSNGGNGSSSVASSGGGGGGGCFIATAAYGSYLEPHVMSLRRFRDDVLLPSAAGQSFVAWYYRTAPAPAHYIAQHPVLRFVTRIMLTPLVLAVESPGLFAMLLAMAFLAVVLGVRRRRTRLTARASRD